MFEPVPSQADFPRAEEQVLEFWKSRGIYEKSLAARREGPRFVFYEGPPTANGMPHPGHCLTRAIKDLFPRYRTMRGYFCERKAGWDTHGLPVEVEVCKELGIHSKEEIEAYGVEPFIQKCQQSVWRYMQQWERLTERLGFWVNLEEAYVTYHRGYVESVWWCLKNLFDRDLLYQGHKIVWWWAQGGTALSSGEVGQGYREVADPSVYVRFPLLEGQGHPEGTALVVWTTTPWTLPSNQFTAVHPELEYVRVVDSETGERLVLATALVEEVAAKAKRTWEVEATFSGKDLLGLRYRPPFDYYYATQGEAVAPLTAGGEEHLAWRIVAADFVTTESGTGVVHQAPAFGEVDFDVLLAEQARFEDGAGPPLICAVGPDGKFTAEAPGYEGRWVKDCDRDIIRELKERGLMVHQEQYLHEYPFCWRADEDPLIQYPRRSWFIRTTKFRDAMLANNAGIRWLPDHIRDGRFGNFLESNVDWALSRERYWGTPLPIWVCEETGQREAIGSYSELLAKPGVAGIESWAAAKAANPELPEDLCVHKPYIDDVTYDSPFAPGARMRRVSEVIDCWFDSGAMPFAQWGYPHAGRERFEEQFPADFISEALDQTRGWFYSLLSISTLLFGNEEEEESSGDALAERHEFPHPYRNCIVLGLMLAESYICQKCGKRSLVETPACEACGGNVARKVEKMSKQLRNYREPNEIFDRYGADALRWYLFANQAPWNSIIYSERAIKESIPEFLLRLWNVYSFFVIYANIDGFDPAARLPGEAGELTPEDLASAEGYRPVAERSELDRWILSELHRTAAGVVERMDAYESFPASGLLNAFVDALSNWYVRRGRARYWTSETDSADKLDAYWTLYECLLTTSKLIAPFTPFFAETLWRNLAGVFGSRVAESVHLCSYPVGDSAAIDEPLSRRMDRLREIASLGRSARTEAGLKVRQPLAGMEIILAETSDQAWLEAHEELLREELNVKRVEYTTDGRDYIDYQVQPNFKRLGPRLGKLLPAAKKALTAADGGALLAELKANGAIVLKLEGESVKLDEEDITIRMQARAGWAAAQGPHCVVVLSTELTPELIREGYAKDVIRIIQDVRKSRSYDYSDRIRVAVVSENAEITAAVGAFSELISQETLAASLTTAAPAGGEAVAGEIGGSPLAVYVERVGGGSV